MSERPEDIWTWVGVAEADALADCRQVAAEMGRGYRIELNGREVERSADYDDKRGMVFRLDTQQ